MVLRRPPRPPLPPSAHDVLREARVIGALGGHGVRVPEVLAVGDDPAIIGSPFFVMERVDGRGRLGQRCRPSFDSDAERRRDGRGADRRPGGDARRRLARRRPRGLRQAAGLPRAPAAPFHRAVGAQQDARDRRGRDRRPVAARQPARQRRGDRRPRRLPARQRHVRARRRRAPERDLRLGDGDHRRSRSPTSATCARCGCRPIDPPGGLREHARQGHAASRASRRATSSSRATRSARGAPSATPAGT